VDQAGRRLDRTDDPDLERRPARPGRQRERLRLRLGPRGRARRLDLRHGDYDRPPGRDGCRGWHGRRHPREVRSSRNAPLAQAARRPDRADDSARGRRDPVRRRLRERQRRVDLRSSQRRPRHRRLDLFFPEREPRGLPGRRGLLPRPLQPLGRPPVGAPDGHLERAGDRLLTGLGRRVRLDRAAPVGEDRARRVQLVGGRNPLCRTPADLPLRRRRSPARLERAREQPDHALLGHRDRRTDG
jgi:hypothetical protein